MKPNVYDVTPTLDTSAYADGDLLFDSTEVPQFFLEEGGVRALQSIRILDEDDQGAALDILLLSAGEDLGTANSAYAISDAESRSILATVRIAATDWVDWGGFRTVELGGLGVMLKAAAGETSLYIAAISRGTPTYTASGLKIAIGVNDGAGGGTGPRGTASVPQVVGGPVADDAAASGNPVPVGGIYNSTLPTYTNGDRTQLQAGTRGSLNVQLIAPNDANVIAVMATNSDAVAASAVGARYQVGALGYVFNGTTWDRARGDTAGAKVRTPTQFVTVDMTAETTALDVGDVVAATQVVASCTPINDAQAILQTLTLIDVDDQKAKLRIVFFDANTSLGTEDAAPDIDDTEAQTIIGYVDIAVADYVDLGGASVVNLRNIGMVVQPASGTDDIYMAIYTPDTSTPTYAGGHIYVRLGFV